MAEPGEEGRGIRVEEGDKFAIPSGWLKLSLDPTRSSGRFTRAGVTWFAEQMLGGRIPGDEDDLDELLDRYEEEAETLLKSSPVLAGFDLEDPTDLDRVFEFLNAEHQGSPEWLAFTIIAVVQRVREELRDPAAKAAFLWGLRLQATRAISAYKQNLEELVWTGYEHGRSVYEIASATARTPAEAEKIRALEPAFARLSEDVLHTWVQSGVDLGPRMGVSGIEEPVLKALAGYHLNLFERRRAEEEQDRQHQSRLWGLRIQGLVAGVGLAGFVWAVLKGFGVL